MQQQNCGSWLVTSLNLVTRGANASLHLQPVCYLLMWALSCLSNAVMEEEITHNNTMVGMKHLSYWIEFPSQYRSHCYVTAAAIERQTVIFYIYLVRVKQCLKSCDVQNKSVRFANSVVLKETELSCGRVPGDWVQLQWAPAQFNPCLYK